MIEIIDLEKEHLTDYEKKYLFTEAPDNKERVNVKRITLRAPDKRTYDFRKGADDEPEDTEPTDTTEDPDIVEDPGDDLNEDETPEDTTVDDIEGDNGDDIVADDDITTGDDQTTEEEPATDENQDATVDDPENQDNPDDAGNTDDIVVDDNENITADDASDAGDNAGTDNQQDDGDNDDTNENNDDAQEKIHKQNLFNRFMTLRSSIENYSTKLSSIIGIDAEKHAMISEVSDKLTQLSDMMYDYMVIKFKKNSYLESMLFYQRTVAAVNLCLDSLSKICDMTKAETKGKKKK